MGKEKGIRSRSTNNLKAHFSRDIAFYAALMIVAFIMRLWQLGERTVHYDECIHFGCGWNIFGNPFGWCYDPWVHGPFQFIGTGIFYDIFGQSEFTARLLPALFGTAIIILPYFLRRQLGRWGSLATSVILAFSPLLMYYSRYARGDIYHAFFTLLIVVCIWNYISDRRQRWLYVGAAALSFDFCNLETTYINLAIILFFLIILVAISMLKNLILMADKKARLDRIYDRLRDGSALKTLISGQDWVFRFKRLLKRLKSLSPRAEVLLLLITLVLPLFASFINLFRGENIISNLSNPWAITLVILLFVVSVAVGLMWDPKRWFISAAIFWGIFIAVWSVFFTHVEGIATGLWGDASYWISQHGVARGGQPWFYYVMLIPMYEFLPLLFAFAGAIYYTIKGSLFSRFLVYWFVMSFVVYSFFGERMPWISLNMVIPVALLGGQFIGFLLKGAQWRRTVNIAVRSCAAVVVILLFSFTAYTACRESYQVTDEPAQMLMYAGISEDVPRIAAQIDALAVETGTGYDMPIAVDSNIFDSGWRVYLHDYKNISTPSFASITQEPDAAVLIIDAAHDPGDKSYLDKYSEGQRIKMLIWFPEDYKWNFSVGWWWDYFWNRDARALCLMTEGVVYFRVQSN